jgi:hypothetical protein
MRQQTTKVKGNVFEVFCCLYLKNIAGCQQVWQLKDVPSEVLTYLVLPNNDFGIDIIAIRNGEVYAVQCKWKKRQCDHRLNVVNWRELSTFFSLCSRTGILCSDNKRRWHKHIVMTNCPHVARVTERQDTDVSICQGSFQGLTLGQWYILLEIPASTVISNDTDVRKNPKTLEELRSLRLNALSKIQANNDNTK